MCWHFFENHSGKITYTELQWNSWLLLMFHQLEPLHSQSLIKSDTEVLCMFLCFSLKALFVPCSVLFNSCNFHVKSFTPLYYFPHFIEWHLFAWIKNTSKALRRLVCTCVFILFWSSEFNCFKKFFIGSTGKKFTVENQAIRDSSNLSFS